MFNISDYKQIASDRLYIPSSGVNVVIIETDKYAGQFNQELCLNIFGYDYAECNRSPYQSVEYIDKMIQDYSYFDTDYFMSLSKDCKHESYNNVICDICPTPNIENKSYPGYPVYNSVSLFFKDPLSNKDMKTIEDIGRRFLESINVKMIGIGQMKK